MKRTLANLRAEHRGLADDVLAGKRFFWLGSGISRNLPDLVELMEIALVFLRDRALSGPEAEDHRAALMSILNDHVREEIDRYNDDPAGWRPANMEPLRTHYSEVFSAWVGPHDSDYLLLDGTSLPSIFGDPALTPGPEHYMIGILIAEKVVDQLASGNWDGLVEKATRELTGRSDLLDVIVIPEDARETNGRAHLAKFHGCAVRALESPERYRGAIIATTAQVSLFNKHPGFDHMRDILKTNTKNMRSLVLGLSIQDQDLLDVFTEAAVDLAWEWDPAHPAYVFAEPVLKTSQRVVLQTSYEDFDANRVEIVARSAYGEYALPLLSALVVEVIGRKLHEVLHRVAGLPPRLLTSLERGLDRLESLVVAWVGSDDAKVLKLLVEFWTPLLRNYIGVRHVSSEAQYISLSPGTLRDVATNADVTLAALDTFTAVLALIGLGESEGIWRARPVMLGNRPFLRVRARGSLNASLIAVTRTPAETDSFLSSEEWIGAPAPKVILEASARPALRRRSSASGLGKRRGRSLVSSEVYIPEVFEDVQDEADLIARFSTAVGM